DEKKLTSHVRALARLKEANHEVVLVSSGAVASGFARLGYASRPETVKGKQASAAVGQSLLIQSYIDKFNEYNIMPAKILLTTESVASECASLSYDYRPKTVNSKQASAAVGQSLLIQSYIDKFNEYNIMPAQILLTRDDFADKERYSNAFTTITELLTRGIIP